MNIGNASHRGIRKNDKIGGSYFWQGNSAISNQLNKVIINNRKNSRAVDMTGQLQNLFKERFKNVETSNAS